MWQNCLFACLHTSNCVLDSSSPIVASLVDSKVLGVDVIMG